MSELVRACRSNLIGLLFIGLTASAAFAGPPVSVLDVGAVGDGKTNDTAAFRRALSAGAGRVLVPAGTYALGPDPLEVPENVALEGDGRASLLKPVEGSSTLLRLGSGASVSNLAIDGKDVATGEVSDGLVVVRRATECTVDGVVFQDCDRACIWADHGHGLTVRDCAFTNVGLGVSLAFTSRVKVLGNTLIDARVHGFQFWGNWEWEKQDCEDLIFSNNYVKNGGGGPIWGCGARRVVFQGNIVDGATDVGLDLEWCRDSVISGNTVRNCTNAGISLFFACKHVTITGNTVVNDHAIEDPDADWYARAGIWLTPPNREEYAGDDGHEDITISGNTIHTPTDNTGPRRGMWLGAEIKNVRVEGNVLSGPGIQHEARHHGDGPATREVEQPALLTDRPDEAE